MSSLATQSRTFRKLRLSGEFRSRLVEQNLTCMQNLHEHLSSLHEQRGRLLLLSALTCKEYNPYLTVVSQGSNLGTKRCPHRRSHRGEDRA